MPLNWININDYSFDSLLLLERFQIRLMFGIDDVGWKWDIGVALRANPVVKWYLIHRCPECEDIIERICACTPVALNATEVRDAEVRAMAAIEDFITYTTPDIMDASSDYIYAWDKSRLFEMADFNNKVVLDVGSGSGRLAFAAAERAFEVYACEPVSTLREYLRDKIAREHITNMRVTEGMAHSLPYPDSTFDIVMSGHVVGDDYDAEVAEITRVVKSGGWLLDCPGEDPRKRVPDGELTRRGWEEFYYVSKLGGDVYRYRKQVSK